MFPMPIMPMRTLFMWCVLARNARVIISGHHESHGKRFLAGLPLTRIVAPNALSSPPPTEDRCNQEAWHVIGQLYATHLQYNQRNARHQQAARGTDRHNQVVTLQKGRNPLR